MREIPLGGDEDWELERKPSFRKDVKKNVGKDGNLRERLRKKLDKIRERPRVVGDGKSYGLKGYKVERVDPYIIIFSLNEDENVVDLVRFMHHSDPSYAPEG